ncbi:succinyl-diaminopimelate desuccinylase [Buchnera aphidicola (Schlechtendalia chinensis)]|uniref:Succinyl-diaminopimelate desuccinylase n=2 Tax=Buchnera aphidicola TaxID=9 RepID=A0A172WD63_BUCSC|nr:succinyl-diaminopimelate desuccinylase [Buchnera aphidicola]ANF16903.1 succinyl-diaminopimelate desuccinylase [Buchnera aphidicola (Schlechtendalia chinensis)]
MLVMCPVIRLAKQLISIPSISPLDLGCQKIILDRLIKIGFSIEQMNYRDINNIWAYKGSGTTLAFAGHTDVVHPGDENGWKFPPFFPVVHDGYLFGRGSADMKGALSAMIIAVENFVMKYPNHSGRIAFLITSDEESKAINGTKRIVKNLMLRKENIEYCVVGEPSSVALLGDVIKNGRRGSLTACLYIYGVQGHIAYARLSDNPIHEVLPFLSNLVSINWDNGNKFFPPTSLQIYEIQSGIGCNNMTPDRLLVKFNLRFSNVITSCSIKKRIEKLLIDFGLKYKIDWELSGTPFITKSGLLIDVVKDIIIKKCGISPKLLTTGGTSDGRFVYRMGSQILELGLVNKTIHQLNECTKVSDLKLLSEIYECIIEKLLL